MALTEAMATVGVGPFRVADLDRAELVRQVLRATLENRRKRPTRMYALHVGGLNNWHDPRFVEAMQRAEIVYADGGSVVLIGRIGGAQHLQRAATTDIGLDVLAGLQQALGRPARLALIGGPPGLAEEAGAYFTATGLAEVVLAVHGYRDDWGRTLGLLRASDPDVVVVGLGAPVEMLWVDEHLGDLPGALLMTCGGWFGHVTGRERRAPALIRRPGVEWVARLVQAPRRLGPRYARGLFTTGRLALLALGSRWVSHR